MGRRSTPGRLTAGCRLLRSGAIGAVIGFTFSSSGVHPAPKRPRKGRRCLTLNWDVLALAPRPPPHFFFYKDPCLHPFYWRAVDDGTSMLGDMACLTSPLPWAVGGPPRHHRSEGPPPQPHQRPGVALGVHFKYPAAAIAAGASDVVSRLPPARTVRRGQTPQVGQRLLFVARQGHYPGPTTPLQMRPRTTAPTFKPPTHPPPSAAPPGMAPRRQTWLPHPCASPTPVR